MKQITILSLLFLFLLSSCSEEETSSCAVNVQVVFPENYATLSFENVTVKLTNKAGGTAYTSSCSSAGIATFRVEPGEYAASVHHQVNSLIFNGRIESITLLPDEAPRTVEVVLAHAKTNALVIKEIYYDGCGDDGGYIEDQYITLYNNSDETLYLDGLCVAEVDCSDAFESPWMKRDPNMERIPAGDISWQFPGDGQDYPLLPGAETTIAVNAVDHTGGEYQHKNSVNLSTVDFGFYHPDLRNVIAPAVKPMNMLLRVGMTNKYYLSGLGSTMVIFTLPVMDVQAYVTNLANREMRPEDGNTNEKFLMIPKEWVIDCIECVDSEDELSFKRVPADLDSEATYIHGGWYTGKSLIRKKSVAEDGRTIYQDTNNSKQDLEVSTPTLKK